MRRLQGCYADAVGEICRRLHETGGALYVGEPLTIAEHMLQAAAPARRDGAPPDLIAAALLHDYGRLLTDEPEDAAEDGVDTLHEELGFERLQRLLPPTVTEPIRRHVSAKRYLVAADGSYRDALSPASILSLELQGGAMSEGEMQDFERGPYAMAACRLRRYDDAAKIPGAEVPPVESYGTLLRSLLL